MANLIGLLFNVLITPLMGVIELVFSLAYRVVGDLGWTLVVISLVVNALSNPLYRMADALQQKERDRQAAMERWVTHIKEHFTGDERFMMLNTYYRQQGYKQSYALSSSVSLLLQVPIFIAAYRYLSELSVLKGASFFAIADLGQPDGLLALGDTAINVLPIAMTLLNCASTFVYMRDQALRDKVQAYGLAALFLVLLYQSPAGLVLYWTCNQAFSLARNLVMKTNLIKLPKLKLPGDKDLLALDKPLNLFACFFLGALLLTVLTGVLVPSALMAASPEEFIKSSGFSSPIDFVVYATSVLGGLFVLWVGVYFFLSGPRGRRDFAFCMALLAILSLVNYFAFSGELGVIEADLTYDHTPYFSPEFMWLNAAVIAGVAALFWLVWRRLTQLVVPLLTVMLLAVTALCVPNVAALMEAMVNVSDEQALAQLVVGEEEEGEAPAATSTEPVEEDVPLTPATTFERFGKHVATTPIPFDADGNPLPTIHLSREGRNVVIIYLDRGIGAMVPYILNEKPELAQTFDGFTFYPNTVSFGPKTVFGSPAVMGGYEYAPASMNERWDVSLHEKHNEASKLMPLLFAQAGFDVTLFDTPLADYVMSNYDYSMYDDVPTAKAYHSATAYTDWYLNVGSKLHVAEGEVAPDLTGVREGMRTHFERSICYYSLFKVAPSFARRAIYDDANYLSPTPTVVNMGESAELTTEEEIVRDAVRPWLKEMLHHAPDSNLVAGIVVDDVSQNDASLNSYDQLLTYGKTTEHVIYNETLGHFAAIAALPTVTSVEDGDANHYVFFANNLTHTTDFMLVPDYVPSTVIDNSLYMDKAAYTVNGRTLRLDNVARQAHYQCNMAALLRIGEWLDYLREEGAYDNTRVIITSDHGHDLAAIDEMVFEDKLDVMFVNPIFMVKDFASHGSLVTDNQFMTNADTPIFALKDVVENPVNPFTGNPVTDSAKYDEPQYVTTSVHWDVAEYQQGTVFDTDDGTWFRVHDDIFNPDNWEIAWELM